MPSAQVFNTVLGPEIAQMLANAAQAETTGRMQVGQQSAHATALRELRAHMRSFMDGAEQHTRQH